MKFHLTIALIFIVGFHSFGQTEEINNTDSLDYFVPREMPEFLIGGEEGLIGYISRNITYPLEAMENNITGIVYVSFVIDPFGNTTEVQTFGDKLGYGLEEEAIRLINLTSGLWKPGTEDGKPISTKFRIPINFTLED